MEPGSRTYLMKQTGFLSVASFLFPHPHVEFPVIIYSCSCGSEARCSRTVDLRAILRRFVPPPFNTTGTPSSRSIPHNSHQTRTSSSSGAKDTSTAHVSAASMASRRSMIVVGLPPDATRCGEVGTAPGTGSNWQGVSIVLQGSCEMS
jgi:hypothetical protein